MDFRHHQVVVISIKEIGIDFDNSVWNYKSNSVEVKHCDGWRLSSAVLLPISFSEFDDKWKLFDTLI